MPLDSDIAKLLWRNPLLHFSNTEEYLEGMPSQTFLFWVDNTRKNTIYLSLSKVSGNENEFIFQVTLKEGQLHFTSEHIGSRAFTSLAEIVNAFPEKLQSPLLNKDVPQKIKKDPRYHPMLLSVDAMALLKEQSVGSFLFLPSIRPGYIELMYNFCGCRISTMVAGFLITADDRLELLYGEQKSFWNTLDEIVKSFKLTNPIKSALPSLMTKSICGVEQFGKFEYPFPQYPKEILDEIFSWLDYNTLHTTQRVNKSWNFFSKNKLASFPIFAIPQIKLTREVMKKNIVTILMSEEFQQTISSHLGVFYISHDDLLLQHRMFPFQSARVKCQFEKCSENNGQSQFKINISVRKNEYHFFDLGHLILTVRSSDLSFENNVKGWDKYGENFICDKVLKILQSSVLKPIRTEEVAGLCL